MDKSNVCPWWMGYMLLFPLRKIRHNPEEIAGPYLRLGMTAIDYGSAMGFFTLPMARMVGTTGKVYCFDVQPIMFEKLNKRAKKAGLENRIETKLVTGNDDDFVRMEQIADFALLFAVAHEVPNQEELFESLYCMLKPGAYLYFAEPSSHVKVHEFEQSIAFAEQAGFIRATNADLKKLFVVFKRID